MIKLMNLWDFRINISLSYELGPLTEEKPVQILDRFIAFLFY